VCWRAVLLEDVSSGQQSSAVVDKTGKKTANVVHRIHFSALGNNVESSLATKHTPAETITCCANFSRSATSAFLPPPRLCCSGCRIVVYKHYVTDDVINGKLVTGYFESLKDFERFSCTGFRTKFLSALKSLGANTVMPITLEHYKLITC